MKRLIQFAQRIWKDEEGATMVEYGIMVALIAAVAIGTVILLGVSTDTAFQKVDNAMNPAVTQ